MRSRVTMLLFACLAMASAVFASNASLVAVSLPKSVFPPSAYVLSSACDVVDAAFTRVADLNETPACRCFEDSPGSDALWVGCAGHSMPAVFDTLRSLNETTLLSRLHIWDSLINIIPNDMFVKIRPRMLTIERSGLALLRAGAFTTLSSRLRHLSLRNNILKKLEASIFAELVKLQVLDMSGNRIMAVKKEDITANEEVLELNLANNEIEEIEDGAFAGLSNLRVLSLQFNKLKTLTNLTFRGLKNLERLDLSHNDLKDVDWGAFDDLKKLRILDFGTNRLTGVQLRGLVNLQKLMVNNNSIQTLKHISLRDLPSLEMLNMDRNFVTTIADNDFAGLISSTRLATLSLSANNISVVYPRAMNGVAGIRTLALQNNEIKSLSYENQPWLTPLRELETLLLSGNGITMVRDHELPPSLRTVALDHNRIAKVDPLAFRGLRPSQFFVNSNQLNHLPRGAFDTFTNDTLVAVDISNNDWQCLCGEEWLHDWLLSFAFADVSAPRTNGCLATTACSVHGPHEDESHSTWVTAVAAALAAVSLLVLAAIAWLFFNDGEQTRSLPPHKEYKARGVNSDRLRLINEREQLDGLPATKNPQAKRVRFDGD